MRLWPQSIRWQMICGLVLLETLSIGLYAALLMRQQTQDRHRRASQRLAYEASSMAMQAREALIQQQPGWVGLSVTMMGEGPTVAQAKVTDPAGNVLFVSPGEVENNPLSPTELAQIPLIHHDEPRTFTFENDRWEAVRPIYTGADLRGYAWVEYDKAWSQEQNRSLLRDTAIFGCIWIASSAVLVLLMFTSITRPLRTLRRATRQLMRTPENTTNFPLPVEVHNEVGELMEAFNGMVASIGEQRAGLNDTLSLLDSMLANAPIGLAFFDRNCRFVRVNQVFAGLTGAPTSRHLGRTMGELLPKPVASQLEAAVLRVFIEQEAVRNLEFNGQDAETGRPWSWLAIAYPVLTMPRAVRWVGVIVLDVTNRKRAEDALRKAEKLAVTGRLAASIAHEINNPLEAITNLLYLLGNFCQLEDPAKNYVTMAEYEVRRIAEIAQQTLRFYRQSTHPGKVRLAELLDSVLSLYQGRLNAQNLLVERHYNPEVELNCFSGEIRQVVANLVGNSIDACLPGGRMEVRARRSQSWRDVEIKGVRFTVADDGSGMDSEVRQHAFEAFYTTKDVTGTGLGLWISQGIVQKHKGWIRVRSRTAESQKSTGTAFHFFIPDLPEAATPTAKAPLPVA
jgi:PAS domain S-box-containing protein